MIPKVKLWRITVETGEVFEVSAPNKALARIGFRMDHPEHWGKSLKIGLLRGR